jgi:hypothetical protein
VVYDNLFSDMKRQVERIVEAMHATGLDYTILRPGRSLGVSRV